MKKTILLISAGLISMCSNAQENRSILFTKPATPMMGAHPLSAQEMNKLLMHNVGNTATGARTTAGVAVNTWYDLWGQNYSDPTSGGISQAYYFEVYPDSSLLDATSGYHTGIHGMGMSFDPVDSSYSYTNVNGGSCVVPIVPAMLLDQTYVVDSFAAPIVYVRNNVSTTVVDSVIIELVVTPMSGAGSGSLDSGAYDLQFTTPSTVFAPISYDETPRFGTIHYNGGAGKNGGAWPWNFGAPYDAAPYINDCYFDSVFVTKERFAFALTDANRADTLSNGTLDLTMLATGIPSGSGALSIPGLTINSTHQHLVSFVSFKSGVNYPLGTNITAANWMKLFGGQPTGATTWFMQSASNPSISYKGSYQDGVWATNQIRYNDSSFTFPHVSPGNEHDVLIASYAYAGNPSLPGFDVPEQSFHIMYTTGPVATKVTNKVINTVSAYPNPATSQLNVTYSVTNNAAVTVTLTNMVGQVVATQTGVNGKVTFATADLADGMYIYTVQAGGERSTGRIAIAH